MGTGTDDEEQTTSSSPVQTQDLFASKADNNELLTHGQVKSDNEDDDTSDGSMSTQEAPPGNQMLPPDLLVVENFDEHLPSTVTLLRSPEGVKVYLVGTAHFSVESQDDVSKVIRNVRPHIVMVELCRNRANILRMDEETIEREAKNITFEKIMATIKENGVFHGLMYTLFLNMSAQLTKELGMAPGGEFRRALSEVRMLPNCVIHFGDRPIQVTLKRALSVLSWWKSIRLVWYLVFTKKSTTKEDIEKLKDKDMLEQILMEMSEEFPEIGRVFVEERDTYLTYSLQLSCNHQLSSRALPSAVKEPRRVVGIVGIGHVSGITKRWGTVKDSDIPPIMTLPPPSRSGQIMKTSFKVVVAGFVLYIGYKLLAPKVVSDAVGKVQGNLTSLAKESISALRLPFYK